jgi:hypothetical protein
MITIVMHKLAALIQTLQKNHDDEDTIKHECQHSILAQSIQSSQL